MLDHNAQYSYSTHAYLNYTRKIHISKTKSTPFNKRKALSLLRLTCAAQVPVEPLHSAYANHRYTCALDMLCKPDITVVYVMRSAVGFKLVASTSAATTGCGFRALCCSLQMVMERVVAATEQPPKSLEVQRWRPIRSRHTQRQRLQPQCAPYNLETQQANTANEE